MTSLSLINHWDESAKEAEVVTEWTNFHSLDNALSCFVSKLELLAVTGICRGLPVWLLGAKLQPQEKHISTNFGQPYTASRYRKKCKFTLV
jgi:hypothetical protein